MGVINHTDHFIREVVNASLPGALISKWDICWLSEWCSLAQLHVGEFGSICVLREKIPHLENPGVMSVRHLPCAGSLDGFLPVSVSWESIKIHKADEFPLFSNPSVANRVISKLRISLREKKYEWGSPVLSCSLPMAKSPKNCSTSLSCEKVGRWETSKKSGNGSELCLYLLDLIFPYT